MWVKTTLEKFGEYGIAITTERQLQDGEYIKHFELMPLPVFFINARFDIAVKFLMNGEMDELLALEPVE